MAKEELKNLHPEDRIKKMKELEEARKKEIEEARKIIRESEEEITERKKLAEKFPIPQAAQEDMEGLSDEGQDIVKMIKKVRKKNEEAKEETGGAGAEKKETLEEALEKEAPKGPVLGVQYGSPGTASLMDQQTAHYIRELSQRPVETLQKEATYLAKSFEEKGYMTWNEQKRAQQIYEATNLKERAGEEGRYSFTEEVAQLNLVTRQVTGRLLDEMYHVGREKGQNELYRRT